MSDTPNAPSSHYEKGYPFPPRHSAAWKNNSYGISYDEAVTLYEHGKAKLDNPRAAYNPLALVTLKNPEGSRPLVQAMHEELAKTLTPGVTSASYSGTSPSPQIPNSAFQTCSAPTPSEKGYEQFIESEDQKIKVMEDILNSLGIVTREEWGAIPPKNNLDSDWDYQAIAIHHAGNSFDFNSTINYIQEEHLNKFDDIGYHYAINKDGIIYEGRPITKLGCHILDGNTGKIGIVLIGDLSERGEAEFNINDISTWRDQGDFLSSGAAPKAMYDAALKLSQKLTQAFQDIKTIGGHYEFAALLNQTRYCPGSHGMEVVRSLRQDLNKQKPK